MRFTGFRVFLIWLITFNWIGRYITSTFILARSEVYTHRTNQAIKSYINDPKKTFQSY